MTKVVSALGEVVDFGKLKIQNDIEEAKQNPPASRPTTNRVSTLDPTKFGMGLRTNIPEIPVNEVVKEAIDAVKQKTKG